MVPTDIQQLLQTSPYFNVLNSEQLELLSGITQKQQFPAGSHIFGEGEPLNAFYSILAGQVQISKISNEGREIILHLFSEGEIFADFPFFSDMNTYPATAICLEETTVLAINGHQFKTLVMENGKMAFNILSRLGARLKKFNDLIGDLSLRNVESRLAKYLLTVSEISSEKVVIQFHKKTLAAIIGTVPETLSRCFKKLADDAIVDIRKNEIHILDRQALARLANMD